MFLVIVIAGTVAKERANVVEFFQQVGLAALAIPPAIYSLIMFFTAAVFGFLVSRGAASAPAAEAAPEA